MTTAYDRIYLPQARKNLGRMLDFGCLDLGFGVEAFWAHFLRSGVAERFGGGESRRLAGMSGIELAREVLECAGVSFQMPALRHCLLNSSATSRDVALRIMRLARRTNWAPGSRCARCVL